MKLWWEEEPQGERITLPRESYSFGEFAEEQRGEDPPVHYSIPVRLVPPSTEELEDGVYVDHPPVRERRVIEGQLLDIGLEDGSLCWMTIGEERLDCAITSRLPLRYNLPKPLYQPDELGVSVWHNYGQVRITIELLGEEQDD